jgi:hypothetical protein
MVCQLNQAQHFATSLALVGAQDAPSGARDSEASEADDALDESDLLAGDDIGIYRKSRRIYVKVSTQAPSQAEIVFSLSLSLSLLIATRELRLEGTFPCA